MFLGFAVIYTRVSGSMTVNGLNQAHIMSLASFERPLMRPLSIHHG